MRRQARNLAILTLLVLATIATPPLAADVDSWFFGGAFSIGGVHFRVGFAEHGRWGSSYYFEAAKPFSYRGYACSDRCYTRGPSIYHHPSCNAVAFHFHRFGYTPGYLIDRFGPRLPYGVGRYYGPPARYYGAPPAYYDYYYDRTPPGLRRQRSYHHRHESYRYKKGRKPIPPGHRGRIYRYPGSDSDSDSH